MRILILFFLIGNFFVSSVIFASSSDKDFAEWLINNGDYYRAISELRKLQWEDKDREKWFEIEKMIISCYQKAEHFTEGLQEWENFTRLHWDIVSQKLPGWYLLKAKLLLNLRKYNEIYPLSQTIESLTEGKKILTFLNRRNRILLTPLKGEKSPFISGILSAVVPGAGQWYAGYPGDGIFTFLVVSTFVGGSYYLYNKGSSGLFITLPLALFFYGGNVYGAVTTTYRSNMLKRYREWEFYRDQNGFENLKNISYNGKVLGLKWVLLKW